MGEFSAWPLETQSRSGTPQAKGMGQGGVEMETATPGPFQQNISSSPRAIQEELKDNLSQEVLTRKAKHTEAQNKEQKQ